MWDWTSISKKNPNEISTDPTRLAQAASGTLQVHSLLVAKVARPVDPHTELGFKGSVCVWMHKNASSFKEPPLTTEINMM